MLAKLKAWWQGRYRRRAMALLRVLVPETGQLHPALTEALQARGAVLETPLGDSQGERFVVERVASSGQKFQAYRGNDGSEALKAWEAYLADSIQGTFTLYDRQHPAGHRGAFVR